MDVRDSVRSMAEAMETKLRKHDARRGVRGWVNDTPESLQQRIDDEQLELSMALECGDMERAAEECVDIANFAMMVRERCLEEKRAAAGEAGA